MDNIEENELLIKINDYGVQTVIKKENDLFYKNVSLESLAEVLNLDKEFDTGYFPLYGTNYMGLKRYIKQGDKIILILEASPSFRTIEHDDNGYEGGGSSTIYKDIPYPGLIMGIICHRKGQEKIAIHSHKIYATKGPAFTGSTELFHFPYSNVYSDGGICWGDVRFNHATTIPQICGTFELFLSSKMNNDLKEGSLKPLLKRLQKEQKFDYSLLKSANKNLNDLVSLLINKKV